MKCRFLIAVLCAIPAATMLAVCAFGDERPAVAESGQAAFVTWARTHALPLRSVDASDTVDLDVLADVIGSAKIVALGEPAHGAHEPLAFRNRLVRYLVARHGLTAVAIESGLSESRRVNEFVLGGPGEARQIAADHLSWGFGALAENVELIQWLRQYNAAVPKSRKIRFYGIDLTGGGQGDFVSSRLALEDSLSYLAAVAPLASREIRSRIEPYLDRFSSTGYVAIEPDGRESLRQGIAALIAMLEQQREKLISASSNEDYAWARRNAEVARELEKIFHLTPTVAPGEGLAAGFYQVAAARDAAMADNVRWALEREGSVGRILLYAHNAHVMSAPVRGGIWSVYPQAPSMMGHHLKRALGANVLIVGVSALRNGPGLPEAPKVAPSLDATLDQIGKAPFFLSISRAAPGSPAATWLNRSQSMRANFTTELTLSPAEAFDALVFLDPLTPALTAH